MSNNPKHVACAEHYINKNTDVICYYGSIDRRGYKEICKFFEKKTREKLLLVLGTHGGDPDAGYRIARAAIHHYGAKNFKILIPGYCKSAGTLICIGASGIVMANQAELGPLDVQLRKQDELFQQSSGLDILRGVEDLRNEALNTFRSYLISINAGSGLSTKVASEISSTLVIGLYQPLFEQVDPVRIGEMSAALQIAKHYGERLDEKASSLNSGALNKLIMEYPTHGFVIDRSEARQLFKQVDLPDACELQLCCFCEENLSVSGASAIVFPFTDFFAPQPPLEPKDNDEPDHLPQAPDGTAEPQSEYSKREPTEHDGRSPQEPVEEQHPVRSDESDEGPKEGPSE